jgi:hypothetical protein
MKNSGSGVRSTALSLTGIGKSHNSLAIAKTWRLGKFHSPNEDHCMTEATLNAEEIDSDTVLRSIFSSASVLGDSWNLSW